ncbi:MAG: hypothetical protein ACK55X_07370 [Synechococcaceae cyanobacterium]
MAIIGRVFGCRVVMMNESHAGTEKAKGIKRTVKRLLLKLFHAALVGGKPHKRHFSLLGIPSSLIFTGYDAIDNDYFSQSAANIRSLA